MKSEATTEAKPQAQTKSAEKKPNEAKNKKEYSHGKAADSNPKENIPKKPAAVPEPPKAYFLDGAQGDAEHSYRTLDTLIGLFQQAIRKAFPEDPTYPVLVVPGKQCDYQCNSAMPIASVGRDVTERQRLFILLL